MSTRTRRTTQVVALQCIHGVFSRYPKDRESTENSLEKCILHSKEYFEEVDDNQVKVLVEGVVEHKKTLIKCIEPNLSAGWKFERLGKLVQSILLLAAYEILYGSCKNSTTINDYLEIAKSFNHGGEVGFINSVLDKVTQPAEEFLS